MPPLDGHIKFLKRCVDEIHKARGEEVPIALLQYSMGSVHSELGLCSIWLTNI